MKSIEWAAGLFEGEGTIVSNKDNTWYLQMSMVDEDVVKTFLDVVGVGKFYELKANTSTGKTINRASVHKKADVYSLLEKMIPYFGHRRAYTALNCLDAIDKINTTN